MITADTSVLIAAFATWHDGHESAVCALNRGIHLIAHTALETYSVLTRLPPPHRVEPIAVHAYLADLTSSDYLTLDARHSDSITSLSTALLVAPPTMRWSD